MTLKGNLFYNYLITICVISSLSKNNMIISFHLIIVFSIKLICIHLCLNNKAIRNIQHNNR